MSTKQERIAYLLKIMDGCTEALLEYKGLPYLVGPFSVQQALIEATAHVVGKRYDLEEDGTIIWGDE